nr:homolog of EHV2 ORF23 tegument protein UL88 [Macronycteris gammaherpesvirus 1]
MLKLIDPTAIFSKGTVKLKNGSILFHVVHSKPLSILLNYDSSDVPVPLIFSLFSGVYTNSIPLYCPQNPKLSMVRLLLSTHPYALKSNLQVGFKQSNGITVLYKTPVVNFMDFDEEPIKPMTTLMICTKEDMSDAIPLSNDMLEQITKQTSKKQVIIDETKNQLFLFDFSKDLCVKKKHINTTQEPKPIIKHVQQPENDLMKYCQLFYTIANHNLVIGSCPAVSFNTILVMSRSHNSLNICPNDTTITPKQQLFLKHLILKQMGLENLMSDFNILYNGHLEPTTPNQMEKFHILVYDLKEKLENAVFLLNTICQHKFTRPISTARCSLSNLMLMEKYFLMFSPRDKGNAINFSAAIIDLVFKGVNFNKLLKFLQKYMVIQTTTAENNMFKIYALLTN